MRQISLLFLLCIITSGVLFSEEAGSISFIKGQVSVFRDGKAIKKLGISDVLMFNDTISTSNSGEISLILNKSTGFSGEIKIKPNTSFVLTKKAGSTGSKTQVELATGSVNMKITRIVNGSQVEVKTESAVMGVRGTEFSASASIQGSVCVTCTIGSVECSLSISNKEDDFFTASGPKVTEYAVPGVAIVAEVKQDYSGTNEIGSSTPVQLKKVTFALNDADSFEKKWNSEQIDAFRANAPKALKFYFERYMKAFKMFNQLYDTLSKNPVILKWMDERSKNIKPILSSIITERKQVDSYIMQLKAILFFFEIDYNRLIQLEQVVKGRNEENTDLGGGKKAKVFFNEMLLEQDKMKEKMAFFRFVVDLYEERSPMEF